MPFRQVSPNAHFIALADTSSAVFTQASVEAVVASPSASLVVLSLPSSAEDVGSLYKDMGKTTVAKDASGNQVTFRLVQFVDPAAPATNGIVSASNYGVGYIMLGLNGAADDVFTNAVVAKVAKLDL
jgi:hypothetical protein